MKKLLIIILCILCVFLFFITYRLWQIETSLDYLVEQARVNEICLQLPVYNPGLLRGFREILIKELPGLLKNIPLQQAEESFVIPKLGDSNNN